MKFPWMTVVCGVVTVVIVTLPYRWTHALSPACVWTPRGLLGAVTIRDAGIREAEMRLACLRGRGLKSSEPVRAILSRWP